MNLVVNGAEACRLSLSTRPGSEVRYVLPSGVPVICAAGGYLSRKPLSVLACGVK